jgi:hypothetical protein
MADIDVMIQDALSLENPANMFMQLFYIASSMNQTELALSMQSNALEISHVYRIYQPIKPKIRLLAFVGRGDMTDNAPLDYLVENSDIQLDLLFISLGTDLPEFIPDHDIAIVALGESDANNSILDKIDSLLNVWPRPYLNSPQKIKDCARQKITKVLSGIPNVIIPETYRMHRNDLDTKKFPITIRPLDTHGGRGFEKIESTGSLHDYLNRYTECEEFYVCPFIDYMSIDGHYRKWRIALIDKKPYICHLAISNNWMVHFQSSGMEEDESKRREEKYNMENFDDDFARRHQQSLYAIADRLALDYVIIDCTETQKGELFLFEADVRGWIHATDPLDIFPYKPIIMQKAFDGFRELLSNRMRQVEL